MFIELVGDPIWLGLPGEEGTPLKGFPGLLMGWGCEGGTKTLDGLGGHVTGWDCGGVYKLFHPPVRDPAQREGFMKNTNSRG